MVIYKIYTYNEIYNETYKFCIWPYDNHNIVIIDDKCDWERYIEGLDHNIGCERISYFETQW